jgi:hypothetical protein
MIPLFDSKNVNHLMLPCPVPGLPGLIAPACYRLLYVVFFLLLQSGYMGGCGVAEQKSGLSYELASQADWQERKKRRFRSFLLILCLLYIFCLLM